MCRMNLIQDAREKSDQPDASKLLVSQLGWSSSDHHSPGHLLNCSPIFCLHRGWSALCCPTFGSCCLCMQVLLKVLPFSSSAPQQGWLSGCSVSIYISGRNAQHLILGSEARNYSSLASGRLERCNPFSLEANPLDLSFLNNMLPSYKISFLSPSLLSWNSLGKKLVLKEINQTV